MANFQTHITVASILSTAGSIVLASAGVVSRELSLVLICLGSFGGIFPDVDSDNSTSIKIIFHSIAIALSFAVVFMLMNHATILGVLLIWVLVYATVIYIVQPIFKRFTVHRGIFHSFPMMILISLLTASFCFYVVGYSSVESWYAGLFVGFGCLVHLLLDEIYSVDFANAEIKRSSGTAIKFFSKSFVVPFIILYALLGLSLFITPRYEVLTNDIFTHDNYLAIEQHFLPNRSENVFTYLWPKLQDNWQSIEQR